MNWASLELIGSADMVLVRNQTGIKFPISSGLDLDVDLDYWILLLCCTFDVFMFTLNLELIGSPHILHDTCQKWGRNEIQALVCPAAVAQAVKAQYINFQCQKNCLVQEHCLKL